MFGYVVVNKPELKFREFDIYHSYYCGLCHSLGKNFGVSGKVTLSYDMTFLVILLTSLYEPEVGVERKRCIAHPTSKKDVRRSVVTDYVAQMNILMTYYKCIDDWVDERKLTRRAFAGCIDSSVKKVMQMYPDKATNIEKAISQLSSYEKDEETNIDFVAACFGNVMAQLICMKDDEWSDVLKNLGFYLGKFIYILDAYEDLEKDIKANRYNVLKNYKDEESFDELCENILNGYMSQCARNFELLPIIQDVELLRNIVYSGVWTRFEAIKEERLRQKQKS